MALPVWPAGLPLADFSRQPQTPFIRTPMDSGLARHRRRFRVYPIVMPVQFLLSQALYAIYASFGENELGGWAGYFMLNIRDKDGVRLAKVRFTEAPTEDWEAPHWRVSGKIEKLNVD